MIENRFSCPSNPDNLEAAQTFEGRLHGVCGGVWSDREGGGGGVSGVISIGCLNNTAWCHSCHNHFSIKNTCIAMLLRPFLGNTYNSV